MRKNLLAILFFGSLWGIIEATLGYVLHLLPIKIGSFIWLPLAFFFMRQVYKNTGKISSIIYISIMAASIKMLNLFLPVRVDKVINPAISIILEGLSCASITYIIKLKNSVNEKRNLILEDISVAIVFNTVWRSMYMIYLICASAWIYNASALTSQSASFKFIVIDNLLTSIIISSYMLVGEKYKMPKVNPKILKPAIVLPMIVINIMLQFL